MPLCQYHMTANMSTHVWVFCSIPVVCVYIFIAVPHVFYYCSSIILKFYVLNLCIFKFEMVILLLIIIVIITQDSFSYLGSFLIPNEF